VSGRSVFLPALRGSSVNFWAQPVIDLCQGPRTPYPAAFLGLGLAAFAKRPNWAWWAALCGLLAFTTVNLPGGEWTRTPPCSAFERSPLDRRGWLALKLQINLASPRLERFSPKFVAEIATLPSCGTKS